MPLKHNNTFSILKIMVDSDDSDDAVEYLEHDVDESNRQLKKKMSILVSIYIHI